MSPPKVITRPIENNFENNVREASRSKAKELESVQLTTKCITRVLGKCRDFTPPEA